MKKTGVILLFIFFFSITSCLFSGFSYQVDYISRYIWRGFDLNPTKKPVVQPQVTYAFGNSGFAVNLFLNFSFEDKNTNELDFTFSYDFKTGENFSLTVGFIYYTWPYIPGFKLKKNVTREFFISAGFPNILLAPTVSLYYDTNLGDGLYAEFGAGHSIQLGKKNSLDLSCSLGYNAGQWISDTGFSDLNFAAAIPLKIDKFTITPYTAYTFVLLEEIGPNNHFKFGISLSR